MKQRVLLALAMMSLVAGWAFAGGEVFDFNEEITKGYERPAFRAKELLKTPEYTVSALAVKEELKTHQHSDTTHVLYIISGHGTMTLDGQPVALKPGTLVHIPKGVTHNIKAEGGEVVVLDFSSHASSEPKK
jgi:quercetin dioxygenase-like cupin family protein